jgi:hypothetical protein
VGLMLWRVNGTILWLASLSVLVWLSTGRVWYAAAAVGIAFLASSVGRLGPGFEILKGHDDLPSFGGSAGVREPVRSPPSGLSGVAVAYPN